MLSLSVRSVPTSMSQHRDQLRRPDTTSSDGDGLERRQLRIAMLGAPNSGKSMLVNLLSGWQTCAVSHRAHTTRRNSHSVLTLPVSNSNNSGSDSPGYNCQLVFTDTPGVVTTNEVAHYSIDPELLPEARKALRKADVVCVLHDVSQPPSRLVKINYKVQRLLFELPARDDVRAVLVLTKVDEIRDRTRLLELLEVLTGGCVAGEPTPMALKRQQAEQAIAEAEEIGLKPSVFLRRDLARLQPRFRLPQLLSHEWLRSKGVHVCEGCVGADSEANIAERDRWRDLVLQGRYSDLSEKELKTLARYWHHWPRFDRVFMTSATKQHGVKSLRDFLCQSALPGDWRYAPTVVTDKSPQHIAIDMLRCRLLQCLPYALGYNAACSIEHWERNESGTLLVQISVKFAHRQESSHLLRCFSWVEQSTARLLRNCFRCEVVLRLSVLPQPTRKSIK